MKKTLFTLMSFIFCQSAFSANVAEMSQQQLLSLDKGAKILILDVRTPEEFAQGHVPGAMNISHSSLSEHLAHLSSNKETPVVVYCRSGKRAGIALELLEENGFNNLHHLSGDMLGWNKAGLETAK